MVLWKFPPRATSITPSLSSTKDNRREKFNKDPKLKALLSTFAAFTTDYLADSQTKHDEKNDKQDKPDGDTVEDDEDVNALLGMFGALKE